MSGYDGRNRNVLGRWWKDECLGLDIVHSYGLNGIKDGDKDRACVGAA